MRAALNFILGGLGAGSAVAAYLLSLAGGISKGDLILPYLAAGAIMASGLLCVWIKIGPQLRAFRLFYRPAGLWIASETYAALIFFTGLAVDWVQPGPVPEAVIALAAAVFLFSQARMIQASKSRSHWRAPEIPSLMIVTGLAEGVGLIAIFAVIAPPIFRAEPLASIAGMTLAMMGAYRWQEYTSRVTDDESDIKRLSPVVYVSLHALPLILYLAALLPWSMAPATLAAGGVAAIAGGAVWKNILVVRLGRAREFVGSPVGL